MTDRTASDDSREPPSSESSSGRDSESREESQGGTEASSAPVPGAPTSLRSLVTTVGAKSAATKKAWSMGWKPPKKAEDVSEHHLAGAAAATRNDDGGSAADGPLKAVPAADAAAPSEVPLESSFPFQDGVEADSTDRRGLRSPPASEAAPMVARPATATAAWLGLGGWLVAATMGMIWLGWSIFQPDSGMADVPAQGAAPILARPVTSLPTVLTESAFVALQHRHARLEHRLEAWQTVTEVDVVPAAEFALERRRHRVAYDRLAELEAYAADQDREIRTLHDRLEHLRRLLAKDDLRLDGASSND